MPPHRTLRAIRRDHAQPDQVSLIRRLGATRRQLGSIHHQASRNPLPFRPTSKVTEPWGDAVPPPSGDSLGVWETSTWSAGATDGDGWGTASVEGWGNPHIGWWGSAPAGSDWPPSLS
ncbi:hypothetical protein B0H15DRAFT_950425 [Mycena belliarum]|uniref:Uncharacterized protein n=1 Tax=Mycena belliarum TaxID=1033014 RepID=A0AAD6XNG9_9AGAR|nr:hypothetical protein B0H15DRAFT_950425 [Mycena belliae]